MSFSTEVKNELSRVFSTDKVSNLSELSALIRTTGSLKIVGLNKLAFGISTENPAIARKIFTLIKECFDIVLEIQVAKQSSKSLYNLNVSFEKGANKILEQIGIIEVDETGIKFLDKIPKRLLSKQENKRAYIRGMFLGCGSITNPQKLYHLEFTSTDLDSMKKLAKVLASFDIIGKIILRKNTNVLYIKDSEKISDILSIIGAHKSMFDFENVKASKHIKNLVNRQYNCENANINKIVESAQRQIDSINYIIEKKGLKILPDNLKEMANMRKKYFDIDMTELGKKFNPPLGKSAVNYRLKKIEKIAEDLKRNKEE